MPDAELKDAFEAAVNDIKNSTSGYKPSNDLKLKMYGLFKQATIGDVSGKKPGMLDVVGRAKYGAWASHRDLSTEEAMREYLAIYNDIKAKVDG